MSIFSINIKQPKTGKRRLPTTRKQRDDEVCRISVFFQDKAESQINYIHLEEGEGEPVASEAPPLGGEEAEVVAVTVYPEKDKHPDYLCAHLTSQRQPYLLGCPLSVHTGGEKSAHEEEEGHAERLQRGAQHCMVVPHPCCQHYVGEHNKKHRESPERVYVAEPSVHFPSLASAA